MKNTSHRVAIFLCSTMFACVSPVDEEMELFDTVEGMEASRFPDSTAGVEQLADGADL